VPRASVRLDADSTAGLTGRNATALDAAAGFGIGVTDALEIGAQVLPLDIAPDLAYGAPSLYAALGAQLSDAAYLTPKIRGFLPVTDAAGDGMLDAELRLALLGARAVRFEVAGAGNARFDRNTGAIDTGWAVPVALTLQPAKRLFFTVDSAVASDPFDARFRAPRSAQEGVATAATGATARLAQAGTPAGTPQDVGTPVAPAMAHVPLGATIGTSLGRPNRSVTDLSLGVLFPSLGQLSAGQASLRPNDYTVLVRVGSMIPTLERPRARARARSADRGE
jgi:hypothetical protein